MKIVCNGDVKEISQGTTVAQCILLLGLEPDFVVAECDGRILKREEYETWVLIEGAVLELVRFVGGG